MSMASQTPTNGHNLKSRVNNMEGSTGSFGPLPLRIPRILSVEEAIPYSPFTSIIPFDPDLIPLPTIGLGSSVSIFCGSNEREKTRYGLECLNQETANLGHLTENIQRNLNHLKELLHPSGLTRYKFKTRPKLTSKSEEAAEPQVSLTVFPQMLFDNISADYKNFLLENHVETQCSFGPVSESALEPDLHRLPPNNQCEFQQDSSRNVPSEVQVLQVVVPNSLSTKFQEGFDDIHLKSKSLEKNKHLESNLPLSKKSKSQLSSSDAHHVHHIKAPLNSPSKNNFKSCYPENIKILAHKATKSHPQTGSIANSRVSVLENTGTLDSHNSKIDLGTENTSLHPSIEKQSPQADPYDDSLVRGTDQREKADMVLRNLQDYLQDIFEEEGQVDPSVSSQFFISTVDGGMGLSINTQIKLDSLLQRAIQSGRFSNVEVDDLIRIQRLCEGPIKDAESLNISFNENMFDRDVEAWLILLRKVEIGIRSARTALRLMAGGRKEMQIYSEDIIQSTIKALQNVVDACIIPIVEIRSTGNSKIFKTLTAEKKFLFGLFKQCQRLLSLIANLVTEIDLSDSVVNALECLVSKLFFVENASSEKESVLGISKFDLLRTAAMDVLSGIFATKPAQRRGILAEFLISLEKLPVSKQSARQFKLAEGGNIQHASALVMRLIQISATKPDDKKEKRRSRVLRDILNGEAVQTGQKNFLGAKVEISSGEKKEETPGTAIDELRTIINPLIKSAKSDAIYVVEFIVARATLSTKGTESPFRHLLDLFVQDFITCLGSLDWPASELLLRLLLFKMIEISKSTKASFLSRNVALDILSQIGPKVSELHFHAQKMMRSVEYSQNEQGINLGKIVELFFETKVSDNGRKEFESEFLSWSSGPFRTCLNSLEDRCSEESSLNSAIAYIKVDWATKVLESFDRFENEDDHKVVKKYQRLARALKKMIGDEKWLSREKSFDNKLASAEIRLAHILILLCSPLCQYLDHILSIFLTSMNSGQAMVQAKSLKCLTQLLDTDPGTIDRHPWVKDQIVARLEDVSSSVRENALGLISKLISLRPSLEPDMVPEVLKRLSDANVSVRRRAIKLAKEIYTRNFTHTIRIVISKTILWKTGDDEEIIQELARQTMEEIWFSPFHQSAANKETSPQFKLNRADLVSLMVETIETSDKTIDKLLAEKLDKVLTYILSPLSKFHEANSMVCKALLECMFETVIDNSSATSNNANSRIGCFHILQVFAASKPKLFTIEHIQILHPYVANLSNTDNAAIFNSVVNIFKHTLSHLPGIQEALLILIRNDLLKSLARLRVTQLDDVISCMSMISKALKNFDNLSRVLLSALETINKLKRCELKDDVLKKLYKLLPIVGLLGKHCDFEPRRAELSEKFPELQHDTVPKLITDIVAPLTSPSSVLDLRKVALQAIGYVCYTWPKNFSYSNVFTAFEQAFDEKLPELEIVAMDAFKVFLVAEEKRSEGDNEDTIRTVSDSKSKLDVMGGSQGDGIALGIAQRFLPKIISVALSSRDERQVFLAAQIIASVARQGLVHPKLPGVALITLGTAKSPNIAKTAFEEHSILHAKHETLFERDYMTAVQSSYDYQRDVVDDTRGAWVESATENSATSYISKLSRMIQVLNDFSKASTRKKFYENLCAQLDRNKPRKDITEKQLVAREEKDHIKFSQFVIENIAFFEYKSVDELLSIIRTMERLVSSVGANIAHTIEQKILRNRPEIMPPSNKPNNQDENSAEKVDIASLKKLASTSMTLLLLWEARNYLRHQYSIAANKREGKVKSSKDLLVKPSKTPGVTGDKFWRESSLIMEALDSTETMMYQCQKFVNLLNFDDDFKAAAEGEEDANLRMTPDADDGASIPGTPRIPGSGRSRKRKSVAAPATPSRKKRCRTKTSSKRVCINLDMSDNE
ncbi:hypothetical protein K3495_g1119 [Podosphaera aphanis]|nr:hypothetical protein K3495_g1119 [Podosphaera aphanis]